MDYARNVSTSQYKVLIKASDRQHVHGFSCTQSIEEVKQLLER